MPATEDDIKKLRSLLRWSETHKHNTKEAHFTALREGLKTALEYLENPDRRVNIALFLLSAILSSVQKRDGTFDHFIVRDRDMLTWALEQAEKLKDPPK